MTLTITDYQRLTGLPEFKSLKTKMPNIAMRLQAKLSAARMIPQDKIGCGVVTMNSRVLLKELGSGRKTEVTITYPHDANPREARVSVFSPIGVELLGRQESDVVSWKTPAGDGRFEIVKVVYQPEAARDYSL